MRIRMVAIGSMLVQLMRYWEAHMDLLSSPPSLNLNDRTWVIHTRSEERPPVRVGAGAQIIDSMITDGSDDWCKVQLLSVLISIARCICRTGCGSP